MTFRDERCMKFKFSLCPGPLAQVTEAFSRLENLKGSVWHMRVAVGEVGRACSIIGASPPESGPLHAGERLDDRNGETVRVYDRSTEAVRECTTGA